MTWLVHFVLGVLALLPLGLLRRFGHGLGWISMLLNTKAARVTRANLAHCYPSMPEAARRRLARDSLSHTSMLALEAGKVWRWPLPRCLSLVQEEIGRDELVDALRSAEAAQDPSAELEPNLPPKPGVLMLVPHLGNWEFLSPWLAEFGVTALYDPPNIKALDPIVRDARERAGIHMAPINRAGLKTLYSVLRGRDPTRSKLAVILPDQAPGRSAGTVEAPFFGQPALTMTLVHRLLKQTRPQVFIGTALRVEGGFCIQVRRLDLAADMESELATATAMNSAIESMVALAPEQYQWEYKRFKRTALARSLYPKDDPAD